MDFTKATNKQLDVLIYHETNIPKNLITEIFKEASNRSLLNGIMIYVMRSLKMRIDDDRIQHGYLVLMESLDNYRVTNTPFIAYIYKVLRNKYISLFDREIRTENNLNEISSNEKKFSDSEDTIQDFIPSTYQSVEKTVINKVFLEDGFSKVTEQQRKMLLLFGEGYSISEIARDKLKVSNETVHRNLKNAFIKINPNRPDVNLSKLGLAKRAYAETRRRKSKI